MNSRMPYLPTARQANVVITIGFLALLYAFYMRYLVIQQPVVGLACDAGLDTWLCLSRNVAMTLFNHSVFGWTALAVAVLNLMRPSLLLLTVALSATALGLVLYNVGLAALAAGLILLSFARPRYAEEPAP